MARPLLRPAGFDDLGLRRGLSDRLLPLLVGAMAFLAALAMAGAVATASLARHWQEGAASVLTVQVPNPGAPAPGDEGSRLERVVALLRSTGGVTGARALTARELADLLRPWLGTVTGSMSLPLPGVVQVHLAASGSPDLESLSGQLAEAAPGTLVESHGTWLRRLTALARSLQACAAVALLVVALVAAAVIAIATRAGLAARRDAIEIVHGLGATDSYIAARFAGRTTLLATAGASAGAVAALPVLLGLASLAAPFSGGASAPSGIVAMLPQTMWLALPALPLIAASIGWITAQGTVRRWLRRLP